MKRRSILLALAAAPLSAALAQARPTVHVYKSPSCGCCSAWIAHLAAAGFAVTATDVADTAAARKRLGMPERYGSCHTALVAGYAIEGHVPAAEIERLLAQRPQAIGLAVPGMPVGSPGMEAGPRIDPYEVLLIGRNGSANVYARYPKA